MEWVKACCAVSQEIEREKEFSGASKCKVLAGQIIFAVFTFIYLLNYSSWLYYYGHQINFH